MVKITNQIITLLKNGKNFSEIARIIGCSRNTVKNKFWNRVKNYSIVIPTNLWGIGYKDIREIIQRKKDGEQAENIAIDFNISKSYVYKLIKGYKDGAR